MDVTLPHRDKTLPETIMNEGSQQLCASRTYISFTARLIVYYIPKRQIINAPQPARLLYSPRVKLVNDALEANNCEKSRAEPCQPGQKENGERQQRLPSRRLRQSPGQASAAASSRGVGPSVARDRTSGVGARFVLTVGGGVVLRHVLEDLVRKALPTATHPSFHQPAPSSAPIFLRNQAFAPTAGIWRCVLIIWIYLLQIPRLSGMLTGTRDPLAGGRGRGVNRAVLFHTQQEESLSLS